MAAHHTYDDAVVGAGILGLAHAYQLARRGRRVIVFERDPRATGASVRNFGMLWPIGQPFGPMRRLAQRSRQIWLDVLESSEIWHERTGSLHLAYREDEAQVLCEFAHECAGHGEPVELLTPQMVRERTPAVKQEGLQLALGSDQEVCVDPREVVAALPGWLSQRFGVDFAFNRTITSVSPPTISSSDGQWLANRVWICSGDELKLLFAAEFAALGLVRCKLQMMRSAPLDGNRRIGPMLAAGLTLRHYAAFENCPGLAAFCRRVAQETPWMDQLGIHVLVSQNGRGELTLGDSHEYGDAVDPFDKSEVEEFILGYLNTFLDAPALKLASRWHGTYLKHKSEPYLVIEPAPGVTAITGVGGAGMTLSFGLAEHVVDRVLGEYTARGR